MPENATDMEPRLGSGFRGWTTCRIGLLVTLTTIVFGIAVAGAHPASLSDLHVALSAGRVAEIHIVGGLPPNTTGSAHVEIYWRDDSLGRYTTVQQIREGIHSDDHWEPSRPTSDVPVIRGDLVEMLTSFTPAGQLRITSEDTSTALGGTVFGWRVPQWLALASLAWGLAVIVTLISGPEPRRATRWAWFWLFCGAGPLALALYPVFGLPRASTRFDPLGRRLTGGWAFLLALLLPKPPFPEW